MRPLKSNKVDIPNQQISVCLEISEKWKNIFKRREKQIPEWLYWNWLFRNAALDFLFNTITILERLDNALDKATYVHNIWHFTMQIKSFSMRNNSGTYKRQRHKCMWLKMMVLISRIRKSSLAIEYFKLYDFYKYAH